MGCGCSARVPGARFRGVWAAAARTPATQQLAADLSGSIGFERGGGARRDQTNLKECEIK